MTHKISICIFMYIHCKYKGFINITHIPSSIKNFIYCSIQINMYIANRVPAPYPSSLSQWNNNMWSKLLIHWTSIWNPYYKLHKCHHQHIKWLYSWKNTQQQGTYMPLNQITFAILHSWILPIKLQLHPVLLNNKMAQLLGHDRPLTWLPSETGISNAPVI